jgi:Cu+-exporting ATPase
VILEKLKALVFTGNFFDDSTKEQEMEKIEQANLDKLNLMKLKLKLGFPIFIYFIYYMIQQGWLYKYFTLNEWVFKNWIQWVLSTPVQFWCGYDFVVGGFKSFKTCAFNMNTLVMLGTLSAYFFSVFVTVTPWFWSGFPEDLKTFTFYEASAAVVYFILLGRFMEHVAKSNAGNAIKALMNLAPKKALLIDDGQ